MTAIVSAKYGATVVFNKEGPKGPADNYVDVTDIIRQKLAEGKKEILVSNDLFGDPIFGVVKRLIIEYEGGISRVYAENVMASIILDHHPTTFSTNKIAYAQLLQNLTGVEIGGPSLELKPLGIYDTPAKLDNVNFSPTTIWGTNDISKPYTFPGKNIPGSVYIADMVNLHIFQDQSYDFTFASHVLEHLVNPLLALKELKRITRPGGYCILVLPWKENTFDHRRPITPFEELLEHYNENRDESDVRDHLTDILPKYDLSRDPGAGTMEQFIARSLKQYENRALHVHVFDFALIIKCLEFFNYRIIDTQLWQPCHQIVLAQL